MSAVPGVLDLIQPIELKDCDNGNCMRKCKVGICYCCGACGHSHLHQYEIHSHSEKCDERYRVRNNEK